MKIIKGLRNFDAQKFSPPRVFSIGNFDGVHRGHQRLIKTAVRIARKQGGTALVLTFFPHPLRLLHPRPRLRLLTCLDDRAALINSLGPDACVIARFSPGFARMTPEQFVRKVLIRKLKIDTVVVGDNFHFGTNKKGNPKFLKQAGLKVVTVPPVKDNGITVSSTKIRKLAAEGKISRVTSMLGRPYSLRGRVVSGRGRGQRLGFPTANIRVCQERLPLDGVYAVRVKLKDGEFFGMLNIGTRPTFKDRGKGRSVEVHVIDWQGDLYGQIIEVVLVKRLRPEKKFVSSKALKDRLRKDREAAKRVLNRFKGGKQG